MLYCCLERGHFGWENAVSWAMSNASRVSMDAAETGPSVSPFYQFSGGFGKFIRHAPPVNLKEGQSKAQSLDKAPAARGLYLFTQAYLCELRRSGSGL